MTKHKLTKAQTELFLRIGGSYTTTFTFDHSSDKFYLAIDGNMATPDVRTWKKLIDSGLVVLTTIPNTPPTIPMRSVVMTKYGRENYELMKD